MDKEMIFPDSPRKLQVHTVFPCCCISSTHKNFYEVFTLMIFVLRIISVLWASVYFGKQTIPALPFATFLILVIMMVSFGFSGYIKYIRTRNYGNSHTVCYAMAEYVLGWVNVAAILLFNIFSLIVGPVYIDWILSDYDVDSYNLALFIVLLILNNIFLLPISIYWQYLLHLYMKVIQEKKEDTEEEQIQIEEDQEDVEDVEDDEREPVS